MASQTEYWNKRRKVIERACWALPYADYAEELRAVYERHIVIIDEVLVDLAPECDDEQYTETTSWHYEDELKALEAKAAELEPVIEARMEAEEHARMLKDMGMTQEQYEAHEREQAQLARDRQRLRLVARRAKG